MKKLILITVIICVQLNLVGQTIEKLDEKNGFKNIKLGTSYKSFTGLVFNSRDDVKKYEIYNYVTPPLDLLTLFDIKFDQIYLMFDFSGKLVGIRLIKKYSKDFQKAFLDDSFNITLKCTSSFGKPTFSIGNGTTEIGQGWKSEKVQLEAKTIISNNIDSELTVHYFSSDFLKKLKDNSY